MDGRTLELEVVDSTGEPAIADDSLNGLSQTNFATKYAAFKSNMDAHFSGSEAANKHKLFQRSYFPLWEYMLKYIKIAVPVIKTCYADFYVGHQQVKRRSRRGVEKGEARRKVPLT